MVLFRRKPKPSRSAGRFFAIVPIPTEGPGRAVVWLEWVHWAYDRSTGAFAILSREDASRIDLTTADLDHVWRYCSAG